ncbi:DUF2254 domain-containing protein [Burkholderiaceae bacterium FT117]|uniref:DUF2254 domain-containing protein n=1 Tax=Zeimonas sediminis TaxID=2944268 RepID=UPI002342F2F3|nr:DUF2254 domain-containing protein [Zeimonas sediminis]MCM5571466.1 DUF2254 domain-containing protein [Zeimonas sediminis]
MARIASRWQWLLETMVRKLWFRASLFSVFAVATALIAPFAGARIPARWSSLIGADAIDNVLGIIASSMLTVTIFSLTTMVSAYASAASTVTPRATRLLVEDSTSQNAMSTFLGAFLFSLVGIIALSTGVYGDSGRVVLFGATIVVIALIVLTLLRWISHLSTLGRMGDTIDRVERAARSALADRIALPCLGGTPFVERPASAKPVRGHAIGYVQHVDMNALQAAAGDGGVWLAALPGAFVHPSRPLAWTDFDDDARREAVRAAFTVGDARTFDQDPRFGLIVLSEIASRALSPAVNDPGTAIDVLGTGVRVLHGWCEERGRGDEGDRGGAASPPYPSVRVPRLSTDDLFEDLFAPIAREGAGVIEVGIRLQKSLALLADSGGKDVRRAASRMSAIALDHANRALAREADRQRLAELADRTGLSRAEHLRG